MFNFFVAFLWALNLIMIGINNFEVSPLQIIIAYGMLFIYAVALGIKDITQ